MDRTTRCPKCGKRMVPIVTISGRTDLQCISCDDPAVKWAESPLTAPDKPIVQNAFNHSIPLLRLRIEHGFARSPVGRML
jgi:hypothetical protein